MGLRLLLAARKSRKGDGEPYERQDYRAKRWAESEGHTVVNATADTTSSQTAPWKRRSLGPWMRDPVKLAMYDGILVSDTDRISRGTQEDFVYIEHWASEHGKRIVVAKGPQYPARNDAERGDWDGQKRRARTYWEDVRDKHADTREIIKANGGAIGLPPFGYKVEGPKLRKTFVPHPVNAPLAREAFQRIADGRTVTSVAVWLTEQTGKLWRVKRVRDMIRRRTYLGERDGFTFASILGDTPEEAKELWDNANSALEARSFTHVETGGRRAEHGYSGLIFCECGAQLYHHQSTRKDKDGNQRPLGVPKYRCGRGRRGDVTEARCGRPVLPANQVDAAVNAEMTGDLRPEWVLVTMGGDHGRQMELQRIQEEKSVAEARRDWAEAGRLLAQLADVDARPVEPIVTLPRKTGKTIGDVWRTGTLGDRRALLESRKGVEWVTIVLPEGPWCEDGSHPSIRAKIDEDRQDEE